jgi:hypothetical protein
MNIIYYNIVQYLIIIIAIIRLNTINKIDSDTYTNILYNGMIIPLVIYSTIGHLIFTNSVADSIGWKSSPFQKELGYFTLSLLLVMIWSNYSNTKIKTKISLSYVWIIFIMFAALNHIYELKKGNISLNNILPIFVSFTVFILIIYNSYKFWL